MRTRVTALALSALLTAVTPPGGRAQGSAQDIARWEREARNVAITRDDWGIAHVHGMTDADAVFGMEYAQAEDDFHRIEMNYLNALGRTAEALGERAVYADLRMQLVTDADSLKALYKTSPTWLKQLMDAFADGLNFYLYKHPDVHPLVITHFEPWMALAFSEGSIGWDIETVNLRDLQAFYDSSAVGVISPDSESPFTEPTGSNGVAIAPQNTLDHKALFFINPHTSHYFRSELQMTSDSGLDAYGAVTWGQFFVYQGFNASAGWMHTSSGVDNIDEFLETVTRKGNRYYYRHGKKDYPLRSRRITLTYKTGNGAATKSFTAYYTAHGPVVRKQGERWVSVSLMQNPLQALIESYTRTRARNLAEFRRTVDLRTNSSNNTVYADAQGNIAYFHASYDPRRDTSFDWTQPVDGSNPATDYHGLLPVDSLPNVVNPPDGWLYNSNNWPWSAAGPDSPQRSAYPAYVERGTEESPRGYHLLRILPEGKNWTMASLTAAMFDSYLPSFERMIPVLTKAYGGAPDSVKAKLAGPITVLRDWDFRWGVNSIATSLAVYWGMSAERAVFRDARAAGMSPERYVAERASAAQLLESLQWAVGRLTADFGTWQTPWGDINRFQRFNDDVEPRFDDAKPSIPVAFTSSQWGSLASFGAHPYPNTKKWYGTSGNSFIAVVEFGDSVRARAITAGGESGDPASPHFNDQAVRFVTGNLRVVYFYRSQLAGHIEREYHPGG